MSGPFPARTVEAVEACARILGGSPDAAATVSRANAATVSGLRAFADRAALRARHQHPTILAEHCPDETRAAEVYASLEDARLDAIGARWLAGVAANLLAHPGTDDDGVRWLAFEAFSGHAAPAEKSAVVDAVRAALPMALRTTLAALAPHLHRPGQFAPDAAAFARAAAAHLPARPQPQGPTARASLSVRLREEWRRRERPLASGQGRVDRAGTPDAGSPGSTPTADAAGGMPAHRDPSAYRAFTTAHDRVVAASALVSRDELAQLRARLDADVGQVRTVVARLAKRLLRVLMARQAREWRFDQEEGQLDGSRLAPLIASRGVTRPFKLEAESRFPDTVVTLLIDHSGSMRGRPMLIAAVTVEVFARVLERCGVRCEVLGFTTREWDGGEPWREWAAQGYPARPGRLNALEHIIIKSADAPWRRARIGLGLFLHDEMLKENIDGEALRWAHDRLLARAEARRILIVVSDGTPMDESTLAANDWDYLDGHLREVIDGIEGRSPVQLAAIGIGHDVSTFYTNATTIAGVDELGPALGAKLMALLAPDTAPPRRRASRPPARR